MAVPALDEIVEYAKGLRDAFLTATGAVTGFAGGALSAAVAGFNQITGAVAAFVQASNPAEMQRFQFAMQDLMASLGVSLEPVIRVAEEIADQFNALFTNLQPVIQPVAELFAQTMKGVAGVIAAFLRPAIEGLAPLIGALLEAVQPLAEPLAALGQALGDLVGTVLRTFAAELRTILPPIVSGLRMLVDVLATTVTTIQIILERIRNFQLLSAFNLVSAVREAQARVEAAALARQQPGQAHTFAARQPRTVGIEELGTQARLAALGARTTQQQLAQANQLLQQIANNTNPSNNFWASVENADAISQASVQAALNGGF